MNATPNADASGSFDMDPLAEPDDPRMSVRRLAMVEDQLVARGVRNERVLESMRVVPRHRFVELERQHEAYEDHPVTLPADQATVSQPYIVAYMTEILAPMPHQRVLEVGSGSGYQAAVLAKIVSEVYAMERHSTLVQRARRIWRELGLDNIRARADDGRLGWPEASPFDSIMVTAYDAEPPPGLLMQLAPGGRLLIPLGDSCGQRLVQFTREPDGSFSRQTMLPCMFVPLVHLKPPPRED